MNFTRRPAVITGVALVGAGVIAVTPVTAPVTDIHVHGVQLTADEEQITLDIVRHGQTEGSNSIVGTAVPGPPLDDTGWEQAHAVADMLKDEGPYAGLYAGEQTRMAETATPLAHALGMDVQDIHILPGLNELDGGVYEGDPLSAPGGIAFVLTLAAWALGLELVTMPGSHDLNGVVFNDSFDNAVQKIYDNTISEDGPTTDVLFSGQASISAWTLLHADNPDVSTFIPLLLGQLSGEDFLPEGHDVVVKGDPEDGWSLVSWDGQGIPQDPDLLTSLIVDVRSLIVAPQEAGWHIWEAVLGGDQTTITDAIQAGFSQVGDAIVQFPQSVISDLVGALGGG
jgi:hypothetical protein